MTHPSEQTFADVPLTMIDPPDAILRENIDPEALGQLADSIAAEGLHQPIGLKPSLHEGRYTIVWGHRRFMAHQLLRAQTIPARILSADADHLLSAITENLQRTDLTPIEEALAIQRLQERGQPLSAIARLMRRSQPWVTARLDLLRLPEDLQEAIRTRALSMSVAAALQPVDDTGYRKSLIAEAQRTGASAATAGLWAQHYAADKDRIVANHYTVEEIVQRREAWRYVVDCEICHAPTDFTETRSLRMCLTCFGVAADALREDPQADSRQPQAARFATIPNGQTQA